MVLDQPPVPGRPTTYYTIIVGQGPAALAVGAGGGCLEFFLTSVASLFFFPLSGRRPDIDKNTVSKPKTTNQLIFYLFYFLIID